MQLIVVLIANNYLFHLIGSFSCVYRKDCNCMEGSYVDFSNIGLRLVHNAEIATNCFK